ncbi:uncharacterized protein ACA1_122780 [Acanthamoeba castellanii str. Neff]|uniref:Uncharacterized protein n=1 Tax=Acanthamoeba castellanii (strain ATCC 30010 / Neff) TaxID=1257118 RepID=L8GF34_ACACF|nr:uncharacterized protein ACA1_122780 [Acanthamoeba castellanii str. Neff]ELR11484.1 hypothetical protein ACA1_122780 [Acanthamoeba castellanii str. Neff]
MYMKAKYDKMWWKRPQGDGGGDDHSNKGNNNDNNNNNNNDNDNNRSSPPVFITGPILHTQLVKLPSGGLLKQFKILHQHTSDPEWIPYMDLVLPYSKAFLHFKQEQDRQRITNFHQRQHLAQAEEDTEDGDPEEAVERRDKHKKRAKAKQELDSFPSQQYNPEEQKEDEADNNDHNHNGRKDANHENKALLQQQVIKKYQNHKKFKDIINLPCRVVPWAHVVHLSPMDRQLVYLKLAWMDNANTNEGFTVESSEFEHFLSTIKTIFMQPVFHSNPEDLTLNLNWQTICQYLVQEISTKKKTHTHTHTCVQLC